MLRRRRFGKVEPDADPVSSQLYVAVFVIFFKYKIGVS